jgi:hypothetical protein
MMRRNYVAHGWVLVFALIVPGWGQTRPEQFKASSRAVRDEVVEVVDRQLAAFRNGKVSEAYQYASANLKAQTPPRTFASIVRENYPIIWSNIRAEYGIVRDDGRYATVPVHVFSAQGDAAYDYVLLKERAGWRIGSVTRHEARRSNNL